MRVRECVTRCMYVCITLFTLALYIPQAQPGTIRVQIDMQSVRN